MPGAASSHSTRSPWEPGPGATQRSNAKCAPWGASCSDTAMTTPSSDRCRNSNGRIQSAAASAAPLADEESRQPRQKLRHEASASWRRRRIFWRSSTQSHPRGMVDVPKLTEIMSGSSSDHHREPASLRWTALAAGQTAEPHPCSNLARNSPKGANKVADERPRSGNRGRAAPQALAATT